MPREEQKILNMPITYTLKLALNDILVPKKIVLYYILEIF